MPRSRGIVSRAASALLFFGAAAAVLIFPEGEAGVSRALGFAPAQVPVDLLQIPGAPPAAEYNPADPRFDTAELCLTLGGELRDAGGEQVCSGVDANDTFCIPGSDNAFPCRGLYKHVILCNAGYNRPALNPFFCGKVCASDKKARGPNCETALPESEWGLTPESGFVAVTVAAGYPAPFHRAFSRNSLAGIVPLSPVPPGLRLEEDGGTVSFYADLNSGYLNSGYLNAAAALIVRHPDDAASGGNEYAPLAQTVTVNARVIAPPARRTFQASKDNPILGVVLAWPSFAGGRFSDLDDADAFDISEDGAVSGTPSSTGFYELAADWTTADMLGTLTVHFDMSVSPGRTALPAAAAPVRAAEIAAVSGFVGARWTITVLPGYRLEFRDGENSHDGYTLNAISGGRDWEMALTTALTARRVVSVKARIVCDPGGGCVPDQALSVTAAFNPVLSPPQRTLYAVYGSDADAGHAPDLPAGYEAGGQLTAVGVAGPGGEFVVDEAGALVRSALNTPRAGLHVVSLHMTHPEFLGTLALAVTADVARRALTETDSGLLFGGAVSVIAAEGYGLEIYRAESRNSEGRIVLPSTIPAGLTVWRRGEAVLLALDHSDPALDGGSFRATALLTVSHIVDEIGGENNYQDLPQPVTIVADIIHPPAQNGAFEADAGVALRDVAFAPPVHAGLSGGLFEDADGADEFTVRGRGLVTGTPAVAGARAIRGRWTAAGMLGAVTLTLPLNVQTRRVINPDNVIADRTPSLKAAQGFSFINSPVGPRHVVVSVESSAQDYKLRNPSSPEFEKPPEERRFAIDAFTSGSDPYDNPAATIWLFIPHDHPIGEPGGANEFGVVMTMIFDVECPDCAPNQRVSMTITMEPIFPPAQNPLAAVYNQSPPLSHTLFFPSDYQSEAGRRLSVLGVNGGADSLFAVSEPGGVVSGNNPPAGAYTVTAGFWRDDFYGRLTMKITAVVSPAVPPEADGISAAGRLPGEITTAFGYAGAVHRVTLEDGNNLLFGDPPSPPPGMVLSRSIDRAIVEFALSGALASGGTLAATTALRAVSVDPNYRELSQDVKLTIRALAAQDPDPRVFTGTVEYENNSLLDLKGAGAPYDGAAFFKESGDAELMVSADGVVGTSGKIATAGVYNIVAGATSDNFLGVARFNIALDLIEPGQAPGAAGIDAAARKKTRAVASDYAGPVAEFAASAAGATLRVSSAPAGFGFDAGDYVAPQALTVALTVLPPSGAATVARFPATILAAGYHPAEISLEVAVRALLPPPPAVEIKAPPFSGEVFDFSSQYYAGGVYRNAVFQAPPTVAVAPGRLGVDANGRVTTAEPLGTGIYGVTVLAESGADYAGTVALSLTLTVGWQVGFRSSGNGVLTARDAAGNALVSGALLAPKRTALFTAVPAAKHYVVWDGANCPVRADRTGPSNPSTCAIARSKDLNLQVRFVRRVFPVRHGLEYQVSAGPCASLPADGGGAWRLPNLPEAAGLLFDREIVAVAAAAGALLPGTPESGATIQLAPAGPGDAPKIDDTFAVLASYYGVRDGVAGLAEALREGGRIRVDAASGDVNVRYCARPAAASYVRPPNPAAVCLSPDCATFSATIAAAAGARTTVTLFAWRFDSSGATVVADANFGLDLAFRGGRPMAVETVGEFAGGARTVAVIPSVELQPGEYGLFDAIPQSGEPVSLIFAAPSPLALREISEAERIPASQRLATIWVASDYSGIVHRAAPALGGAGNVVIAPESVPQAAPGSALFVRAQNQALELHLRESLSARRASLRTTIRVTLTGAREGVYIPRVEEVVAHLHSLPPPLPGETRFDSSDSRIGGGAALYDFAADNPEYAGLLFERISGSRKIEVLPDGRVRVRLGETLDSGRAYVVRAGVRSSPARQYRGDAEFDLRVIVDFSDAEMAAHLPERTARASAAEGHSGAVYTLTLAAGGPSLTLRYLSSSPGIEFDSDNGEIALSSPISADYAGNLAVQIERLRNPASYNAMVSVLINAARAPPQLPLVATIGAGGDVSGAPHQVRLPQGFAAEGFAADILEVAGGTTDNFAYANGGLTLGATAPAAGSYVVALGLRHGGFAGTLRAEVPAWVGEYGDIADRFAIPSGQRFIREEVSPSFTGEVGQVAASAGVELLPLPAPENLAWITSGEKSRLALHLTSPPGSAGQVAATATIAQLQNGVLEEAEVAILLTALAAPPEARVSVVDSSASAGLAVATLNLGGKLGISFGEIADDADAFEVNGRGIRQGEVALTRQLSAGTYGHTVGIWWTPNSFPAEKFLGTVFHSLRVDVLGVLPLAAALPPGDGSEILAAAGYSGTLTVFVPSHPEVSLRFPEAARAAFDARTDYGYDYGANALTRKSPLGLGEEDVVRVTLEANRSGYASREAVLTVSIRALGDLGASAPAPPGAFGVVYDLAAGALEGAVFERDDASSPKLSLLPGGEVSVSPLSPLGGPGSSYTLFASAAGRFLGRAELSLAVRVEGRLRRGLFYQELADSESSCAALGAGWRPPNLAEAAGLLFDGETAEINSRRGEFLSGFPPGGSVNIPLSGLAETNRHRLILPSESPGLGTSFPSRLESDLVARTTQLRDLGGQANARVILDGESPSRHCVYPGAPDYAPPSDPAAVCHANADASGCAPMSGVSDVAARTAGAAATVTIAAGRGVEFLSRAAEDGFYVSLLAAEPSDLFTASEAGAENGLLAVRVELSRGLEIGEEALGTLRLAPRAGATTELTIRFSGPAGVRRGLLFSPVSSGRSCLALGAGWRLPNWAEAAGLIAAGSVATVFAPTDSGAILPGVSADGAEVSLFASAAGDSAPLGATLRSGLLARTGAGLSAVLAAPDGAGGALSQISEGGEFYCVHPVSDSYKQPPDPAEACLAPDCGRTALTSGEPGARTLATLFAWRFGPSGGTATVLSAGFGLDVSRIGGAQADVENVGAFVGGARTVALTAREEFDIGAFAEFSAVPQVGATLRFRLVPYVLFGGQPLALSAAVIAELRTSDFGHELLPPLSVTARYFGARRGLHYVRTPGVVADSNAYSVCEAGGAGWRIPRIGELAGLFSDSDAAFGTLTDSGLQRDAYDLLSSLAGARRERPGRPGTRVEIPSKVAGDSPLAAARAVERAHYADVIHSEDGAPQAFHIVTEEDGRVQISLAYRGAGSPLSDFQVICVSPTDAAAYQAPPQLAEARLVPPRSFDSAVFDRLIAGDGVFHRITARAFRYARGAGPDRAAPEEDVSVSLSFALGGEGAEMFSAELSAPESVPPRSELRLRQSRALTAGDYILSLGIFAPTGVTATLELSVSVPRLAPAGASGHAAAGFAGGARLTADLSALAGYDGLTVSLLAPVLALTPFEVSRGESALTLSLPAGIALPRAGVRAELIIAELAGGVAAEFPFLAEVSAVYAPRAEDQQLHFADAGEQFDAETRYLDAAVDLALRRSGVQPFSPRDAGARATIAGVSGGAADQFVLGDDGNLRLRLPESAAAGVYRATIAFAHPGFAGTVTVIVPAEVADAVDKAPAVDAFVPARERTLYALGGYSGPLFTLTSDIRRAVFSEVTVSVSADGLFGVWQPESGRVDVTLLVSLGGLNPSDVLAELRATVSHPDFPDFAEAVTVTIRALDFVPGDPGFVEVFTDATLSEWEFSGFADALSPGSADWDRAGLVVNYAGQGGQVREVNLFELATESSGGRRAGGLYFRAGVTRASLAAVLGGRPRSVELTARYVARGGDFLGAAVLEADIRISRAFHPDDFVARRNLTLKSAPRGDEAVAESDYTWPVTSVFMPGQGWGLSSVSLVSPAVWADVPGFALGDAGAFGFDIEAFAARAPRAGEVLTDVFVFRGDYPSEYYSEGGLVTVSVALSALAEVPRDEMAIAATTRLSALFDENGNTVLYSGWSGLSDLYADLSFQLDSGNPVNSSGLPIAVLPDGKVVVTGERESDARLSDVFDVGSSFYAAVYAESPDFVGRLRMTTEIFFPLRLGGVVPRLPDGVPTGGDVAWTGEDGRENCRRFGGRVVTDDSLDEFSKSFLPPVLLTLYDVCKNLDRSRSACKFDSENIVMREECSDYLVKVRDCNLKNRWADDLTRAGDAVCGDVCPVGLRARGSRCNLLVFYDREFVATSPGGATVVASDSHSLSGDARVEYLGNRRGLRVMGVSSNAGGDLTGAAFATGRFGDIREFCSQGGVGWRLPRLTEAAGLVHSDAAGRAELTRAAETVRIPGVTFPLKVNFKRFDAEVDFSPALSSLGSDVNVISDLVALTDTGGSQAFRLAQARAEGGVLLVAGGTDNLRLVCVQNSPVYAPLANPSGLLVDGREADDGVTLTFSFSPDLRAGAGGLLTLEAWRYDDSGGTIIAADDEISHAGFASGGVAAEGLLAEVERTGGRVILEARLPPDSAETEIRAHSQTGRTITVKARFEGLRVTVDYAAEPAGGVGGILTVAGLASGGEAYADSTVVFSARPAAGWHVSAWSRACETGGGVATECALTASGNLSVTVFFARVIASVARVVISEGFSYENANLADLKRANPAVYGAAAFFKDGGDAELTVSADGVIGTDGGIVQGGLYRITVGATGAGIKGRARFDFALDLIALGKTPGTVGIPENRRERTRLVVAGYADRIGEYVASAAGATLRAPPSAPPGFDFRAGADYVSPKVLTITLTALLQPGAVTVGRFSVTILAAGYEATEISLALTVSALTAPQPQIGIKTAPFSGAVFDFSDSSYAGGIYGSVVFDKLTSVYVSVVFEELTGEGASAELDVSAGGLVTTAAPLPAGVYGITVLAESDPAFKGTATLALWLTVRWALEYGVGAGDGDLTARDESGAVLNSGATLAPGALVTFTAQPAANWRVASWSGSCGEGGNFAGEIGSADSPGESRICAADARENLRVSVVFARVKVSGDSGTPDGGRDVAAAGAGAVLQASAPAPDGLNFGGAADSGMTMVGALLPFVWERLRAIFPKNSQRRLPPPFAVYPPVVALFPNKAPKPSRASGTPAKRNKCHASA